ncbi:MAG: response regulator [Burkholderiales bacterium]|nr:response regulator [Anaerolineae bacterium]
MNDQPSILYVEDDAQSRRIMQLTLVGRMKLSHVTIFEDSSDFLEHVKALDPKPDLIFLDIHVRPYDGFEMLKMLREIDAYKTVPIVALTASVMNEEVFKLRTAGFDACISKPIDITSFPVNIQNILAGQFAWNVS